jgi:hypothetical protein
MPYSSHVSVSHAEQACGLGEIGQHTDAERVNPSCKVDFLIGIAIKTVIVVL